MVIVDEFSMLDRGNFEEIVNAIALTIDTKVIFVEDSAQLLSVKEEQPIVASDYINNTATLDGIVRYRGIAIVAENICHDSRYNFIMYPFQSSSDRTIVSQPQKQWL